MKEELDYTNKTVLLVEDNEMNIRLFSFLLKRVKIQFDTATDGEQGLELFRKNHYDLILTDINIPNIKGDEMTRIIRQDKDEAKSKVPIVALTASILISETELYLEAGINQVLIKPFTEPEFKEIIEKYLS